MFINKWKWRWGWTSQVLNTKKKKKKDVAFLLRLVPNVHRQWYPWPFLFSNRELSSLCLHHNLAWDVSIYSSWICNVTHSIPVCSILSTLFPLPRPSPPKPTTPPHLNYLSRIYFPVQHSSAHCATDSRNPEQRGWEETTGSHSQIRSLGVLGACLLKMYH